MENFLNNAAVGDRVLLIDESDDNNVLRSAKIVDFDGEFYYISGNDYLKFYSNGDSSEYDEDGLYIEFDPR